MLRRIMPYLPLLAFLLAVAASVSAFVNDGSRSLLFIFGAMTGLTFGNMMRAYEQRTSR